MKNKKLFAILTLVCFMFTLMPVAAFAADYTVAELEFNADGTALASGVRLNELDADNKTTGGYKTLNDVDEAKNYVVVSDCAVGVEIPAADITTGEAILVAAAKAVAKAANDAEIDMSALVLVDDDDAVVTEKAAEAGIEFEVLVRDANGYATNFQSENERLYVWAVEDGVLSSALTVNETGWNDNNGVKNVFTTAAQIEYGDDITLAFARAGKYTVYAGIGPRAIEKLSDIEKLKGLNAVEITVRGDIENPETYKASLNDGKAVNPGKLGTLPIVTPNNVFETKVEVNFTDRVGNALIGKTVAIETNSAAIEVNKASDVIDSFGNIDFEVAASVEGTYEIELSVDGVAWTITVTVGNTAAAYITVENEPAAPQALFSALGNKVRFAITDINGNIVDGDADGNVQAGEGMEGIRGGVDANQNELNPAKYLVLVEKPADSNLTSTDLSLKFDSAKQAWYVDGVNTMDAEGTYTVKVVLDNGAFATASWEVKKFQTPVQLIIGTSTDTIELGGGIDGELLYYDVNGVEKAAKDAEIAATGYAVNSVAKYSATSHAFALNAKDDEKYVGSVITATAVSEKYDLVATKEFKVADGAVAINFVDKAADVNVNNKLEWNVVDSTGTRVALGYGKVIATDIKYIVLDKPEGAKVSTNDATNPSDLANKGIGKLSLTSNKVGNVAVQVVVKATYDVTNNQVANQVKYYTGTQIIAVGTQGVGDVVVMSIGSNEIVINDAKATIDAAPIVENNRTFVPFRALAEAFGATVAYDEATQAVTAELNGVTVVMTIGSAEYTVNGVAKTADVAPFINGSRTMVPVRFAAEAFGIKVIPTYDENGATADILFNL